MPINLAVDDKIQSTIYTGLPNQYASTVVNFRVSNVVGTPTDAALAIAQEALYNAAIVALLNEHCEFYGIKTQIISPTRRPGQFVLGVNPAGLILGDLAPTQTAGLITTQTDLTGRSYRGRAFIPGVGEASNTVDGDPNAAYITNLGTLGALLFTQQVIATGGGATVTLIPTVYSRFLAAWTDVKGYTAESLWATQRGRSSRNRPNNPPA